MEDEQPLLLWYLGFDIEALLETYFFILILIKQLIFEYLVRLLYFHTHGWIANYMLFANYMLYSPMNFVNECIKWIKNSLYLHRVENIDRLYQTAFPTKIDFILEILCLGIYFSSLERLNSTAKGYCYDLFYLFSFYSFKYKIYSIYSLMFFLDRTGSNSLFLYFDLLVDYLVEKAMSFWWPKDDMTYIPIDLRIEPTFHILFWG